MLRCLLEYFNVYERCINMLWTILLHCERLSTASDKHDFNYVAECVMKSGGKAKLYRCIYDSPFVILTQSYMGPYTIILFLSLQKHLGLHPLLWLGIYE